MLLSVDAWRGRGALLRPVELWGPDKLSPRSPDIWKLSIGPPRPKHLPCEVTSACEAMVRSNHTAGVFKHSSFEFKPLHESSSIASVLSEAGVSMGVRGSRTTGVNQDCPEKTWVDGQPS